jgi:hypothetical protein
MTIQGPPDLRLEHRGAIWLARHLTDAGESWLTEFVASDQSWGESAVVIEHEHVQIIAEGATADGLQVEIV